MDPKWMSTRLTALSVPFSALALLVLLNECKPKQRLSD
jgi:hypothetical protein